MTSKETIVVPDIQGKTKEEQIRLLKKARAVLLDEIHIKQQLLDRLDYMIYEIKTSPEWQNLRH